MIGEGCADLGHGSIVAKYSIMYGCVKLRDAFELHIRLRIHLQLW